MKKLLFILFVVQCFQPIYAQKTTHPITKKSVKVFENEELSFYFPKSWKFINHSYNDSITTIAPKHLLKIAYKIPQYYANTIKEIPDDFMKKGLKHPTNRVVISPVQISFFQFELKDSISFYQFTTTKLDKYNKTCNIGKIELNKKSASHYIFTLEASTDVFNNNILQHYYLRQDKIQVISFTCSEKYKKRYLKEFELLLSNFEFKTPKTASQPHLKP